MTVWLYYRKSIDKMVLLNDSPESDWKKQARNKTAELYIGGRVTFENFKGELVPRSESGLGASYVLKIEAYAG